MHVVSTSNFGNTHYALCTTFTHTVVADSQVLLTEAPFNAGRTCNHGRIVTVHIRCTHDWYAKATELVTQCDKRLSTEAHCHELTPKSTGFDRILLLAEPYQRGTVAIDNVPGLRPSRDLVACVVGIHPGSNSFFLRSLITSYCTHYDHVYLFYTPSNNPCPLSPSYVLGQAQCK